jgi:hypothetical protein
VHAFMPLSHFTDSDSEGSRLRNTGKRFNEMNSPNYAHLATRAVCGGPALPKLAPGGVQEARRDEVRQTRNLLKGGGRTRTPAGVTGTLVSSPASVALSFRGTGGLATSGPSSAGGGCYY